ncbi:MAG: ABC transporter permease [Actinomycetes bacterium]
MLTLAVARLRAVTQPWVRVLSRPYVALPLVVVAFFWLSVIQSGHRYSLLGAVALTGLGTGAISALSGMGLVLTYRATGVFNFAQGAIAMTVAYVYFELVVRNSLPTWAGGLIAIVVVGPGIGLLVERLVFRPLERRAATTSEKLVATLGLTVLLIGLASAIFTLQSFLAPSVLPLAHHRPLYPFGPKYIIDFRVLGELAVLLILSGALTALLRFTRLGTEIRAVVDRRGLAELSAIDANRVSAISWMLGCGFAGIVGVLYASSVALDPFRTTLLVVDTFAVAVAAKLRSLPIAVVAGLGLGVAQAMVSTYHLPGSIAGPLQADVLEFMLPLLLIVYRSLDEIGTSASAVRGLVTGRFGRGGARRSPAGPALGVVVLIVAVCMPFLQHGDALVDSQKILALTVAFCSIVAITGFSGHISLGQAGFAGLGAFLTAKLSIGDFGPKLPVLLALLVSALIVAALGFVTGYPALRRKGLILALFTIAVGVLIDTLLLNQDIFQGKFFLIHRPSLFGLSLVGDHAYYWFELVVVIAALALTRNLRSGRLGRILGAMRDSDVGAVASGISLRRYKLFIFSASAFLAAIGGAMLMLAENTFTEGDFSPLSSLFWFTAVVVAGLSYLSGAVVAAILFILFDALLHTQGASQFVIGLLALLIAFLPGGLVGTTVRLVTRGWVPASLKDRYVRATESVDDVAPAEPEPVASPLAHQILERT